MSTKEQTEIYAQFMRWWLKQDWDGAYSDVAWDAWWEASREVERLERRFREAESEWVERYERLRAALTQIENWVGKEYADLDEAESIRAYIDKACEQGLGPVA